MSTRSLPAPQEVHDAHPVDELSELRDEMKELRDSIDRLEKNYESDRKKLGAMLHALRNLFGGNMEAVPSPSSSASQPHSREAWEAWKRSLPQGCGTIIDALLVQPLKMTQMKSICKMAYSTVAASVKILERNALIEREGSLIRLKRL